MRGVARAAALAGALFAAGAAGGAAETFVSTQSAAALNVAELAQAIAASGATVVFLGEIHDNADHHVAQAEVTAALQAVGGVKAVVFEMISPEDEAAANAARGWPNPAPDPALAAMAVGPAVGWGDSGWPDWALYAPILAVAPDSYIVGAGAPREALRPFMQGLPQARAALRADPDVRAARFDQPLPADQQARRDAAQISAHCDALPAAVAPILVAAQRLRDARLAGGARRAAAVDAPGRFVIVITGSGHARRDHGAPAALSAAAPDLAAVSVGLIETSDGAVGRDALAEAASLYDYVAAATPPDPPRPDPCAAFRAPPPPPEPG